MTTKATPAKGTKVPKAPKAPKASKATPTKARLISKASSAVAVADQSAAVKTAAVKAVAVKADAVKADAVKAATAKATPLKTGTAKKAPAKPGVAPVRLFQVKLKGQALADTFCEPFTLPSSGALPLIDGMGLLSEDRALQKSPLWGLLPADLMQRTGFTGSTLSQAIAARPGYDVYFCHANPELESVYHNPWLHAETTHPNFLALARAFLKVAGLSDAPLDTLSHSSLFATGHLIVAAPGFWADYLDFIKKALSQAQQNLDEKARVALFEAPTAPGKLSVLYLIVARLLGHFLLAEASPWKVCKLSLPQDKGLNIHLRLLREMKDTAVAQQSRWLTACWGNYRALYFAQTLGKNWIAEHLPAIRPKTLKFGPIASGIDYAYPRTTESAPA